MNYKKIFIATTDTVVGIGGPATKEVKDLIFKLKNRSRSKPLLIMVSTIKEARKFSGWNDNAEELAKKYWPGATTIVLEKIGIRIPNNKKLIKLLQKIGPIYMTSANKSGQPTTELSQAIKEFPEITKHYNFGKGSNKPSTIIRASNLEVLR